MAKVNQLKNQARREEQRENWSRAIELYTQALDASRREAQGFADLSLYNRIGDIYLRIGQKNTAVRYYEQAIELYAEQDLHTSAIALCNKVLRILPDRSTVFLQLGRLNLATNLVAEGREHYHRYAIAMRKRGSEAAALEALEELISSTGDSGTLTLWAGWLAESPDVDAALTRIESVREALERHGIDPDEVAAQVRSKTVVGFEGMSGGRATDDPLAGAFLTLGEDEPVARPRSATTPGEAVPSTIDGAPDPVPGAVRDPAVRVEPEAPGPVEPGSIPWEQEVEEILAEFELPFEDAWPAASLEDADAASDPDPHERRESDLEGVETPAGWRHATAGSASIEPMERDEAEYALAEVRVQALEADDERAHARDAHAARADVHAPESDEGSETEDREPPAGLSEWDRPEDADRPPSGSPREATGGEEASESTPRPAADEIEPSFALVADDLESIVQAAADLGESAGFDEEPAVGDELPEPAAVEPSETGIDPAAVVGASGSDTVRDEPPDTGTLEPEEPRETGSVRELAESLATPAGSGAEAGEPIGAESDEEAFRADEAAWLDEARHALDERARIEPETKPAATDARAVASGVEPIAEAIAHPARAEAEPDETPAVPDDHESFEPEPSVGRSPDRGAEAVNGRHGGRAGTRDESLDPEPRAPLAEPRLTGEEDPEDAFHDWVQSASTGILKRALSELENRKEHERALAVIERLAQLEETAVEFKVRRVDCLEALGRTAQALEACVALGAALEVSDRWVEARYAYRRAEHLDPGDARVREALERLRDVEEDSQMEAVAGPGPKRPYMPDHMNGTDRRSVMERPLPTVAVPVESRGAGPRPYSGVAGGSEAGTDFEQLLSEFRAELHEKPARNDSSSRTELGAQLKEMGRLDDAIRELQAAVREPSAPPLAFELLGEAFLEKGQPRIAVRFLEKALGSLSQGDRDILGVLYQLGIAYEALADLAKALICYERIFSVDIDYRDIQARILSCSA